MPVCLGLSPFQHRQSPILGDTSIPDQVGQWITLGVAMSSSSQERLGGPCLVSPSDCPAPAPPCGLVNAGGIMLNILEPWVSIQAAH